MRVQRLDRIPESYSGSHPTSALVLLLQFWLSTTRIQWRNRLSACGERHAAGAFAKQERAMKARSKFVVAAWFIVSWCVLIVFTLKPIGATTMIKMALASLTNEFYTPQVQSICDFEDPSDFSAWDWSGTFIEPSRTHAAKGAYSAKVTYYAKNEIAALVLQNYDLGPMGIRDWSRFKYFSCSFFNPFNTGVPLSVKIKDRSERAIDVLRGLKNGENTITIDLEDVGQYLDLTSVASINFYLYNPETNITLYVDNLCLERGNLIEKRVLDMPAVTFLRLSCPPRAKRGESITISGFLSLSKELRLDYRYFFHIVNSDELRKGSSKYRWYINADYSPQEPTTTWKANTAYEFGPLEIFIPKDFAPGEYTIQAGLFNPFSQGRRNRRATNRGMMDFRSTYPRLRYVNHGFDDYAVGKVEVE